MLFLAMKLAITDRGVKFAFLVAFTLTLVIELFVPPTLGLADNGDFQKVAAYFDLFPILSNPSQDNGKFHFFSPKYTRDVHLVLTPPVSGENWTRFVYSIPYQLQYARRTDAEFIDVLYLSGLHRPPDEAGRRYWLDALSTHGMDRAAVFHAFMNSPEWKLGGINAKGEKLISTTPILVAPGVYAARLLAKDGLADIRLIGFVYAAILVATLAWVLPVIRGFSAGSWALLLLAVWLVLGDVSYAVQLNSFFIDTGAFVALFVAIVCLVRMAAAGEDLMTWIAVLLGIIFFTTSKLQHVPAGLCFGTIVAPRSPESHPFQTPGTRRLRRDAVWSPCHRAVHDARLPCEPHTQQHISEHSSERAGSAGCVTATRFAARLRPILRSPCLCKQ